MNQFPPSPGDIRKARCTTGINATGVVDTGVKFATIFLSLVYTVGKFATGVNDTGGIRGSKNRGSILSKSLNFLNFLATNFQA